MTKRTVCPILAGTVPVSKTLSRSVNKKVLVRHSVSHHELHVCGLITEQNAGAVCQSPYAYHL